MIGDSWPHASSCSWVPSRLLGCHVVPLTEVIVAGYVPLYKYSGRIDPAIQSAAGV